MEYKNDIPCRDREQEKGEEEHKCEHGCERECNIHTSVKVPVELEPEVRVGRVEVECCGDPEVKCECTHENTIRVVITQNLFIKLPICYEVKAKHGKGHVECRDDKMQ